MTVTVLIVFVCAAITIGLVLSLIRLAYLTGLAQAKTIVAEEKQKRIEDAARSLHEFDTHYADLTDEDLKHRLRNL